MASRSTRHPPYRDQLPYVHIPTPGDHFSPLTGSAIPTVIDGLSRAGQRNDAPRPTVVVATGTYGARYESADVIEYSPSHPVSRNQRVVDLGAGRLGMGRPFSRREWSRALEHQHRWPHSIIMGHNSPQLMPSIDTDTHLAVLYAHNELLQRYGRREASMTLASVSHIPCVSDFLAERTYGRLTTTLAQRVAVVPNGVDCDQFHPREDSAREGDLEVLYVGRTIHEKGPDLLLQAVRRLNREDIRVRVVGSYGFDPSATLTEYEKDLRALSEPLGKRATFVPTVVRTQVPRLLREADVMVVPSRWDEPFGLTVMEGMATGIPVIATTVGGIPQAMGNAGMLVPPDDADAIAAVLQYLADNESARQDIGRACRQHALDHTWHWSRSLLDTLVQQ